MHVRCILRYFTIYIVIGHSDKTTINSLEIEYVNLENGKDVNLTRNVRICLHVYTYTYIYMRCIICVSDVNFSEELKKKNQYIQM